jgi:hypothetical protein
MAFPSLSNPPTIHGWEEKKALDPTIRSTSEWGYSKTRARTTRIPYLWRLVFEDMTQTDRETLMDFEDEVAVGADDFTWTHPIDSEVKTCRLKEPIRYTMMNSVYLWRFEVVLEEV